MKSATTYHHNNDPLLGPVPDAKRQEAARRVKIEETIESCHALVQLQGIKLGPGFKDSPHAKFNPATDTPRARYYFYYLNSIEGARKPLEIESLLNGNDLGLQQLWNEDHKLLLAALQDKKGHDFTGKLSHSMAEITKLMIPTKFSDYSANLILDSTVDKNGNFELHELAAAYLMVTMKILALAQKLDWYPKSLPIYTREQQKQTGILLRAQLTTLRQTLENPPQDLQGAINAVRKYIKSKGPGTVFHEASDGSTATHLIMAYFGLCYEVMFSPLPKTATTGIQASPAA